MVWLLITVLYTFLAMGSCAAQPVVPIYAVQIETPPPAPEHERQLSILSARGEDSHRMLRAANLFMLEHPGTLISVHTVENEADYAPALRSRLLDGGRVDLFHIFGHGDMIELAEHLDDLSDLYWAREATADTLEPVSIDDRFYGIPFSVEGVGLIVNTRIFAAAEIPLADTGDDFGTLEDAWRELRALITLGNVLNTDFPELESVTSLPGIDDDFISRQLADIALGGEFGSSAAAAQAHGIAYTNAQSMGLYVSLLARYTTHGGSWAALADISRSQQVDGGLAIERVAVIQQSTEIYPRLIAANSDLEDALAFMPIPLPGAHQGFVYTYAPAYWAVNAAADEDTRALAREFLTWLYRSEAGAAFLAEEFGALSPFRETAAPTGNPLHDQLLEHINNGRALPRRHREFPEGWAVSSFGASLREYLVNPELSWEEVTRQITQDWIIARG